MDDAVTHATHHRIVVAGEPVELLPERAVWWPAASTLLVADLHWGKSETFHHAGIPVPAGVLADDLGRIDTAIARCSAERVTVLGDLIHGRVGVDASVVGRVAQWRGRHPQLVVELVPGNHDRHLRELPESWRIDVLDTAVERGPFALRHHPDPLPGRFVWSGHLHPTVRLAGGGDELRLPCFHLGADVGVLPAFSAFTGGVTVRAATGERIYAIAEDHVLPL